LDGAGCAEGINAALQAPCCAERVAPYSLVVSFPLLAPLLLDLLVVPNRGWRRLAALLFEGCEQGDIAGSDMLGQRAAEQEFDIFDRRRALVVGEHVAV
jgi:hypothetical protein